MKNVEDVYPLSAMQEGMLFDALYEPGSGAYVIQLSSKIEGDFNVAAFQRAWQTILKRHPSLRSALLWEGVEKPLQVVRKEVTLAWDQPDWRGMPEKDQEKNLQDYICEERRRGFNFAQAPLMRMALIRLRENRYQFLWSCSHLVLDGWSSNIIFEDLFAYYRAYSEGRELSRTQPHPYRDLISWMQQQDKGKAEAFWRSNLKGFIAPTVLGSEEPKRIREANPEPEYRQLSATVDSQTLAKLQTIARQHRLMLNTLVQGAWAWLLGYYSGAEEVLFGVTVTVRPVSLVGVDSIVGPMVNTLPMRAAICGDKDLVEWLKELQDHQVEIRKYEYTSLVEIKGWSEIPGRLPLFESIVVFQNFPLAKGAQELRENLRFLSSDVISSTAFPLTLVVEVAERMSLNMSFDHSRFSSATVERMLQHIKILLGAMADNLGQRVGELTLVTATERRQLVVDWNDTAVSYGGSGCVHELFEEQARKTPLVSAVQYEGQQLTYEDLNRRANQLAHYLRAQGVERETLVGICLERSLAMMVGVLGILKAGAAYLPMDPSYPAERLRFMQEDAGLEILLTQQNQNQTTIHGRSKVIYLDRDWEEIATYSPDNPVPVATADNPAYVIYTSGSTGHPKGVVVEHRQLLNQLLWCRDTFRFGASDRVLQKASLAFDASLMETLLPLISGARIVMARPGGEQDPDYLVDLIREEQITYIDAVPTLLDNMIDHPDSGAWKSVRLVTTGGETLNLPLVRKFQGKTQVPFWNCYGPTETTIQSTVELCEPRQDTVSIGRPIANNQVYVLHSNLNLVPIGVKGELYIGGANVARGYLGHPDLTAERFVPNPFSSGRGERLYRTGDLGKWSEEGKLEFLGRIDHQVKIRGFRIELGEIEAVLASCPGIREAAVVVQEQDNERRLIGYFVSDQPLASSELREQLRQQLPEYMVPAVLVRLQALPLTPSGKVHRAALPPPDELEDETEVIAPRDPLEEVIAGIWRQILNRPIVNINANFFDLGGHSLNATRVVYALRKALGVDLPLRALHTSPTIAGIAAAVVALREGKMLTSLPVMTVQSMLAEAVLDPEIAPNSAGAQLAPVVPGSNLLLTGASGFLGAFLLAELLHQIPAARVYCLVRAATAQEGVRRLRERLSEFALWEEEFSDRIVPVPGDLAKPSLGLSSDAFHRLASEIDAIYHNGASINFFYGYSKLKPTNVGGTKEILRLATLGPVKAVHYVSSSAVFFTAGGPGPEVVDEETSLDAITGLIVGYRQTKWVAERLMRIARERGVPVTIYRLAIIGGHSRTGLGNPEDLLSRVLQGSLQIGAIPEFDLEIDLAPVDFLSGALVWLSRQPSLIGKTFHLLNPRSVPWNQIVDWLIEAGMPVERLPLNDWLARLHRAAQNSADNALYSLLPFLRAGAARNLDGTEADYPEPRIDCRRTVESLAGSDWACPPLGAEHFRLFLSHLERGKEQGEFTPRTHQSLQVLSTTAADRVA